MARDVEYYEMLRKIPGVVSDYLSGLTYQEISQKRCIGVDTIGEYLKNKEALKSLYGVKYDEKMRQISERKASNMRRGVVMIDLERIASGEKSKSK